MKVEILVVGAMGTNCYLVINEETNDSIIIDPGENGKEISQRMEEMGYIPKAIILTHGHTDHVHGIKALRESSKSDIPVYCLAEEVKMLEDPELNLSDEVGYGSCTYPHDKVFFDGDEAELCGLSFKVIATPGHTRGGCCYYFESEGILFSGDTLFEGSIGRTDFPGGNLDELTRAIREKLYVLPDDTLVYPGHMEETTIGREKSSNAFVRC